MKTSSAHIVTLIACLSLAACGGGSGSGSAAAPTPSTPAPTPSPSASASDVSQISVASSQSAATAAVATVNAAVANVQAASQAPQLPGGVQALPLATTTSGSVNCTTGTYSYAITLADTTFAPVSETFQYNQCFWGVGADGTTLNGGGSITWNNYAAANNYTWTANWDVTYATAYSGYSSSGEWKYNETCSITPTTSLSCSFNVGANSITNISASSSGSVTTVTHATVKSGTITVAYSGWVYNASTGRATAGTATVSDTAGNSITITVTSTGYNVAVTVNGSTTTYSVGA